LGVEADASWLTADGTDTCLAYSGFYASSNCHSSPSALGTIAGRLGYAWGPSGHSLLYVKGGTAWVQNRTEIDVNNLYFGFVPQPAPTTLANIQLGWAVGVGVEQAITPAWSLKLEYEYLGFASSNIATSPSVFFPPLGFPPGTTTSMTEQFHVIKLGLNYKVGMDPNAQWGPAPVSYPVKALATQAWAPGWQFEGGTRYWYSSGKFQWDNAQQLSTPQILESRLTYNGLTGSTGEYFQRIDSPFNVFVKGNIGLGIINGGQLNDEDWGIFDSVSYSNTLSSTNNGKLGYGTIDVGYDALSGYGYKVGAFVGYNYFTERWDTFGCAQIANQFSDCVPTVPTTTLIGTQDSTWQSLRVGANSEVMLVPALKLTADLAYLPYVSMTGRDNHLLRATTTFFDQQGTGQGVQLEAIMSYFVTDNFSVGVGGRYWAMWTTNGTFVCTGCGGVGVISLPDAGKFNTERYGTLLQADYRFGSL
jgi:opacity protein-like surface antigen